MVLSGGNGGRETGPSADVEAMGGVKECVSLVSLL